MFYFLKFQIKPAFLSGNFHAGPVESTLATFAIGANAPAPLLLITGTAGAAIDSVGGGGASSSGLSEKRERFGAADIPPNQKPSE